MGVAAYTMLILLVYRIHYSIDIFTAVIFAEWCFTKVDLHKESLDYYWVYCLNRLRHLIEIKYTELPFMESDLASGTNRMEKVQPDQESN